MRTSMSVYITVSPSSNGQELYNRLKSFKANVIDLGDSIFVTLDIDIREDTIEKVLMICREYGECVVEAYMAG